MNLSMPIFSEITIKNNLFDKNFISFVLIKYLFEGKDVKTIENEYFNGNAVETGALAYRIIESFGLIANDLSEPNIGMYRDKTIDDVCKYLNDSNNEKAILLANSISKIVVLPDLSEQQLGSILSDIYTKAAEKQKISELYLFGIKFGKLIGDKNYSYNNIISYSNLPESLSTELGKAVKISKYLTINTLPKVLELNDVSGNEALKKLSYENRVTGGTNEIYYGAPGCGKSQKVKSICEEKGYIYERTTFYPDYTNGEFIGQVVPEVDKDKRIEYKIQPGYFTKMLFEAMLNPDKKYCLIIEEINRGNASAIFGDIFQLLDRDNKGLSEYKIENNIITGFFKMNGYDLKEIRIPSNMWILATMNTSDQNVYTLDTAFKRRWDLKKIKNSFDPNIEYDEKIRKMIIPGSNNVTWETFITKINSQIFEKNSYGVNAEDKQIGKYFVGLNELENPDVRENASLKSKEKAFADKVLMYLWEDVTKLNHEVWFNSKYKTLDDLLLGFENYNLKIFNNLFDVTEDDGRSNE